jgi:NADH-ubiquinone oxidoreductase chain 4
MISITTTIMLTVLDRKKTNKKIILIKVILVVAVLMAFSRTNIFKLFLTFEAAIAPTIIIITSAGAYQERAKANMFIITITIITSIPLLIQAAALTKEIKTELKSLKKKMSEKEEYLQLMLTLVFLAKLPIYILHIWLPKAHVQAPTIGSMILAGIILKLGGYGLIIISKIIKKRQTKVGTTLALVRTLVISINRVRQSDKKMIIAYSSISHIIIILANILTLMPWIQKSSIIRIVRHGLVSAIIFLGAGLTVEEQKSKNLVISKATKNSREKPALWFMILATNIRVPPSLRFIIEIEIIINISKTKTRTITLVSILIIRVICIVLAINFIQGNKKTTKRMKPSKRSEKKIAVILMLVTLTTASGKFS